MKAINVSESAQGMARPKEMFDLDNGLLPARRDKPVTEILPVTHNPKARSLKWLRDTMPYQDVGSEG